MSSNQSNRKQLSGCAKRKLKQINDEQVNKIRGSMDQFIKKKPKSEIGRYKNNNNIIKLWTIILWYSILNTFTTIYIIILVSNSGPNNVENSDIIINEILDSAASDVRDISVDAPNTGTYNLILINAISKIV